MATASSEQRSGLTTIQWLICTIAAIGFAFDIYELLMLPLIVRPALMELGGIAPGTPEFATWVGRLFYIPAFAGGVFGLLGGYLTDRLGRRRVLTYSILLYAVSAFLAGFSTSLWMLLVLRCTTFVGVCVEFVAAVAWLAELFTDPHRREKVIGYTQAFSSVGGLLVAVAFGVAVELSRRNLLPAIALPDALASLLGGEIRDPHAAWRYTLMSGLIPAIPLIIIRPFLPESPAWEAKRKAGTLRRPRFGELFAPGMARTTIVTTLMFACSYGAAFGAIQMIPQIVPGLPEVKQHVAEATEGLPKPEAIRTQKDIENKAASNYTKVQEVGGLAGRFLLALLVVAIVSRRSLLRVFQVPGLFIVPLVFAYAATANPSLFSFNWGVDWDWYAIKFGEWNVTLLHLGIFLAGLFTVAQFSFWGNYLPRVYPLHLRGTGESFAANIGGRMVGTCFAWVTSTLAIQEFVPGAIPPQKVAYAAAGVAFFVYFVGVILSFFLPEPSANIDEEETIGHGEASPFIPATVEPKRV
ncbi:MAG: MFS transporter [Planctomycetota bacterium]|nr:MFS transporter [Planctomycetaceae bacterium]MDQ3332073.1 MFS transporter [Planctomycetota bacterium]